MRTIPTPSINSSDFSGPVVITGAGGMLGWDITRLFKLWMGESRVIPLGHGDLDVTDLPSIRKQFALLKPSAVINCAAYTNVDLAETEREDAKALNQAAPGFLATGANEVGAHLIHFSTDQVFDGRTEAPYTEEHPTHPLNQYAATKCLGELPVIEAGGTVLRVQWLYGEKKDRFTYLKHKEVFTPFADQYGAPTWTEDICRVVAAVLTQNIRGLYHLSYDDFASWAEVFAFVKEKLNLSVQLKPKLTKEVDLPAKRPEFSTLSNQKLISALGWSKMGSWKDSLSEFLDQVGKQ